MSILALVGVCILSLPCGAIARVKLADPGNPRVVIQVAPGDALSERAAQRLASFIEKACGKAPPIKRTSATVRPSAHEALVVIGAARDFKALSHRLDLDQHLSRVRRDGYLLRTAASGRQAEVVALGQTSRGAVNAVWRLIREAGVEHGAVTLDSLDLVESPYIPSREAMVTEPWMGERDAKGKLKGPPPRIREKYCQRNWAMPRLRAYLDLLDSFGYNAIQLNDTWPMLSCSAENMTRQAYSDRLRATADYAHSNGQFVDLFVFGSSVSVADIVDQEASEIRLVDTEKGDPLTGGACFTDPRERRILLKEYDWLAENYASHVDRFMTHWTDPGGCRQGTCQNCTIQTALQQHNILLEKFRARNPAIQSAFSLWLLHLGTPWPGYLPKGPDSVLDAGILDPSVTIAGGMDWGQLRHDGRPIAAKGRRFGVWGWYFLDIECYNGLQVHTQAIEKYFQALPSRGGEVIDWHSVETMSSYLVLSNLYVAGQMMWNPQRSGSQLLREFTGGMFGRENEERMASVYDAIEVAGDTFVHPGRIPWLAVMEQAPARLARLQEARKTLDSVRIAPDFVPAFPTIIEPGDLLQEMRVQLAMLQRYLEFQVSGARLLERKQRGESGGQLERALQALPEVPRSEEYLWDGTYKRYQDCLRAVRQKLGL